MSLWIRLRPFIPAAVASLIVVGFALVLHWGLWELWVQRYDIAPQDDLSIELAFAASLVSFLTLGLAVGFGWFAIHEFQQARKRDVLELICSDTGSGRDVTLYVEGDDDYFELNVFVRNNGDSIASVFGFTLELPFLKEAEQFDQRQPDWGPKRDATSFGAKVIAVSSISALGKNIQLRKRDSQYSLQFTNSHDIAVFPSQTLLLFSVTVPAEAFIERNGSFPSYKGAHTLYTLNGEPEDGEWEVTFICGEGKAMEIAENRELRHYPKLRPKFSKPVIDRTVRPIGHDKENVEACVFALSVENHGALPADEYTLHVSVPFLESVWDRFKDHYILAGGQADRILMFSMMKEFTGQRDDLFRFYDDSTLDTDTTLALEFSSRGRVRVAPQTDEPIARFEIPTHLISSTYGFTCQYSVSFMDGKERTGEVHMYLANDIRYASNDE